MLINYARLPGPWLLQCARTYANAASSHVCGLVWQQVPKMRSAALRLVGRQVPKMLFVTHNLSIVLSLNAPPPRAESPRPPVA